MDWDTIIDDKGTFSLPGRDRVYRDWALTPKNPGGQGKVDLRRLSIVRQIYIFTTWRAGWISEGLRVSRSNSASVKS